MRRIAEKNPGGGGGLFFRGFAAVFEGGFGKRVVLLW
jgi:hypothetical protein